MYSLKLVHCSKQRSATYFIDNYRASTSFLAYCATTLVSFSSEAQSSRLALDNLKKKCKSLKKLSRSNVDIFFSPDTSVVLK